LVLTTTDWILAFIATFIFGVSKSGLKGIAVIAVTLMALVFGSKASTGIIMPLLMIGDVFAIIYYRKHLMKQHLFRLLPWIFAGVLIGVFVGKDIPELFFKKGMAAIIIGSILMMFWWDRRKDKSVPTNKVFGISMGLTAGFTTMVGNLAGAFANLYFLAIRLPKNAFISTSAWLFFFVNWFKIPFHIFTWKTITVETLKINLYLIPVEVLGLFIGVKIVARIKDKHYRIFVMGLTAIGALILFFR